MRTLLTVECYNGTSVVDHPMHRIAVNRKRGAGLIALLSLSMFSGNVMAAEFDTSRPSKELRDYRDQDSYPQWWKDSQKTREQRVAWWKEARFGQFMHWGAYSVLGGGYNGHELKGQYSEHIARILKIPKKDYIEHAASKFCPEKFDADEWVLRAKNAGMQFFVITAKHHDGFAIYHSKYSDFDVEDAAKWPRDPLKELSEACKRHGLKFGVYYSHAQDWYSPGNTQNDWDFPGNPATSANEKKMGKGKWFEQDTPEVEAHYRKAWDYYVNKSIPQVIELLEGYNVEFIWFDTASWMPPEFNIRVLETVRKLAPDTLVNYRIQHFYGDYLGGPDSPVAFAYHNQDWECIQSTLHSWGYNKFDEHNRRHTDYLLRMLATVVSKDGVMMINIGPKGDGTWTDGDISSYGEMATWWKDNGESIRGAGMAPLSVHNWGVVTGKDNGLYLHVFDWPADQKLQLGGLLTQPESVILLEGNQSLAVNQKDGLTTISLPAKSENPYHEVIKLSFAAKPQGEIRRPIQANISNRLHVYDTPLLSKGLGVGRGKAIEAYVSGWSSTDDFVTWPVIVSDKADYNVHIIYDLPHEGDFSDPYQLTIGEHKLNGTVNREGNGDERLITAEMKLMKLDSKKSNKATMITDSLGKLSLDPGQYDLKLSAAGSISGKELFRPRAIILEPIK